MKNLTSQNSLFLLLALLATACHKPEPDEPTAVPLPAELKSYTLFQPGTYWVYQDSASLQLDSVWVVSTDTNVLRGLMSYSKIVSFKYEYFTMRTRSSSGDLDMVYTVKRHCALPMQEDMTQLGPCWSVTRGRSLPGSTAEGGGADVFPYALPRDMYRPDHYVLGTMIPYWHSQPIDIGGRNYPDVMEVWVKSDGSEGGWSTHYYWAPGLGIVRQRVRELDARGYPTPRTRTLVRSHIVQ